MYLMLLNVMFPASTKLMLLARVSFLKIKFLLVATQGNGKQSFLNTTWEFPTFIRSSVLSAYPILKDHTNE